MSRFKPIVMAACAAGACSVAVATTASAAAAKQDITIGVTASLTGDYAACGVEQTNAVKLWVNHYNASQSKYDVSLDIADDQSTPGGSLSAMQKVLSNSDVVGVIGECNTAIADATIPVVKTDGRPVIFFSASELPGRSPNIFSLNPPQAGLSEFAAKYVFKKVKAKTVSIMTLDVTTEDLAKPGITAAAKAMGVKVLSDQLVGDTVTNFQSQVLNAIKGNPDVIDAAGSPTVTGAMVKELRQDGYKGAIMASQAGDQSATYATGGSAVNGLYVPTYWDASLASKSPLSQTFVKSYKATYKGQPLPDVYAAAAYDAAITMTDAISKVGTDKSALVKAIATGKFNALESPTLAFAKNGLANLSDSVIQYNSKGVAKLVASS